MLGRLIHWCLKQPWVVVLGGLVLAAAALWWVRDLPFEVFPALTPAETVIQAEAPGLVAEQVEQLVTRPIENALGGVQGVASIRSESVQGLSVVTLEFDQGAKPGPIRQTVVERLAEAAGALPPGVAAPRIAPFTAASGEVLQLGFTSRTLNPMALRNIVQWTVRPRLLATPGVANVALYGGQVRRVEVRARPGDLSDSDLGFADVLQAVRRATSVAGAGFMDTPSQRIVIDPRGQALKADDVAAVEGDIGHAGRGQQTRAHGPLDQAAQGHGVEGLAGEADLQHIAGGGGERGDARGADPGRQGPGDLGQALDHGLTDRAWPRPLGEVEGDDRKALDRLRMDGGDARGAAERVLDRPGDQLLDLFGDEAGRLGLDHGFGRGQGGEDLGRQVAGPHEAAGQQGEAGQDHHPGPQQAPVDHPPQHQRDLELWFCSTPNSSAAPCATTWSPGEKPLATNRPFSAGAGLSSRRRSKASAPRRT